MISEDQQDQAALYALGLLDADEAAACERALVADGELRALVEDFRDAAASLVQASAVTPPAGLRERVLSRVAAEAKAVDEPASGKVVAMPPPRRWVWVPWAAAAVLALACTLLGTLSWKLRREETRGHRRLAEATRQLDEATQKARLAEAARATEAGSALLRVSYCALQPVPAAQQTGPQAAVLWDAATRRGRLQIQKLPPPGTGKDYQLWTVETGHKNPVSAGVVRLNADGGATVDFQPGAGDDADAAVAAFALSVERAGGAANNEGPILFLGKLGP